MHIESDIIYSYNDLRRLLLEQTKEGSFYLLLDDIYFEEITSHKMITREILTSTKEVVEPLNIIKYIQFKTNEKYTTKEMYEFIDFLRNNAKILVTIFNPKEKETTIIFVSSKTDIYMENYIEEFLDLEGY